jgi:macrolide transport system ATP-binding/permease protein
VAAIGRRLRELEAALERGGHDGAAVLAEYADLAEQFEQLGGYTLDHRIDTVLAGLGIAHLAREREVGSLSGGEKARAALAALLLRAPDLLLLDEPTNHLDCAALDWLESFLESYQGAFVVASHDRRFLNRTATAIVEIDEYLRDARVFPGNYDAYLEAQRQERARWEAAYAREQETIKQLRDAIRGAARQVGHPNRPPPDNDKFARTFFGENAQRAVSRNVRAAQEKLRRIEENPLLKPPDPLRIRTDFEPAELAGKTPLAAHGIVKAFGDRRVLDGAGLALGPSSRVVLTGHNGAGKSTLLRILAGIDQADVGTVDHAPTARIGYLDQEQEELNGRQTLFEAYCTGLVGVPGAAGAGEDRDTLRADLFRYGFFRRDDVDKQVGQLSVGQRRKLQIARLVGLRANVLLLDEPTNHVDLPALEAFEAALMAFPGPILAVSHDRWFIERMVAAGADVWTLRAGKVVAPAANGLAATYAAQPLIEVHRP